MATPADDTNNNMFTPTEEANDATDPITSEEDTGNSLDSSSHGMAGAFFWWEVWVINQSRFAYRSAVKEGDGQKVFNKKCAKCTKNKNNLKPYKCIKNYDGSSNSMEAAALTKMLIRISKEKGVSIVQLLLMMTQMADQNHDMWKTVASYLFMWRNLNFVWILLIGFFLRDQFIT